MDSSTLGEALRLALQYVDGEEDKNDLEMLLERLESQGMDKFNFEKLNSVVSSGC